MGKTAVAIDLTPSERRELESLALRRKIAQGLAQWAHRFARGRRRGEQGHQPAGGRFRLTP